MLEVLDAEFVKLARVKGLAEHSVIWKHALLNAFIPVVTFVGFMFGIIIASSITTEIVFVWPGLGRLMFEALMARDFPVIQGVVLIWSALIIGTGVPPPAPTWGNLVAEGRRCAGPGVVDCRLPGVGGHARRVDLQPLW